MTKHLTLLGISTVFAIALSAVVGVSLANAAAGNIYNLGTLGGTSSAGYDINDAGQVAGSTQDAVGRSRAFLWDSSHGMTDLGTTNGYTQAGAHAINDAGSVVGWESESETVVTHAFAWTPNEPNGTTGTMTDLAMGHHSDATDINAAGQVVGSSTYYYSYFVDDGSCTPDAPHYPNCGPGGYWVTETSTSTDIWENGVVTYQLGNKTPIAINDAGQVVGYTADAHAFRIDGTPGSGVIHDLGTLGGRVSAGIAINDDGQVVGSSSTTGNTAHHAFRYTGTPGAGGVMIDLGTLGGANSEARKINDAGFVVGLADRAAGAGGGSWPTLWLNDAGNTAVDLDAWLDANNPTLGAYWTLSYAFAINNNGLITGQGIYDDGPGGLSDGSRAFVLDASSLMSAIPGDFNLDGTVDAADYVVWRKTGINGPTGYNIWRANFGQPTGSGSDAAANATVPEPATLVLLMFAATGWGLPRHRAA